jgi:hypothetical protein
MKKIILPLLLFLTTIAFGQSIFSSLNSGALSTNNLIYSVGEIYVIPTVNPNEANSGLIGALSLIEFFVTGLNGSITSYDLNVFPNPTSNSIYFKSSDNNTFQQIFIYDNTGRLVLHRTTPTTSIDLTNLSNGIYTITTNNTEINSFKIIKQ